MFLATISRLLAGIALSLSLATAAAAQGAPLSLVEAQEIALRRSLETSGLEASAIASRHMAVAASQRPDPVLRLGLDNVPVNGADRFTLTRDFMTMARVGVMQELTRPDKLVARGARFEREAELAVTTRLQVQTELRRNTALTWFEHHFQHGLVNAMKLQRREFSLQVEATDAAYRAGRGAQSEVFAVRLALAQLDDQIAQAQGQLDAGRSRLARWIGRDAERRLADLPDMATLRINADEIEAEVSRDPRLAVLSVDEALATAEANIARSNQRPDWTVELMYSQRGSAYSNMVSVGFAIPLRWDQKNRQDRELSAKLAMIERQQTRREELARDLSAEAQAWLQQWKSNRTRLAHYDSSILPLAAQRTGSALSTYRGGSGALNPVLEARRMELEVRLERLRLEMETASLWTQLNFLRPDEQDLRAASPPIRKEP